MSQMDRYGPVVEFYHCLGSRRLEERRLLSGKAPGNWACLTNQIAQFTVHVRCQVLTYVTYEKLWQNNPDEQGFVRVLTANNNTINYL